MLKISIAHATRRPAAARAMMNKWLAAAARPERVEYIFGIDSDDESSLAEFGVRSPAVGVSISPPGGGCVRAYNAAAALAAGEIIIGGSDDFEPISRWDEIIVERFRAGTSNIEHRTSNAEFPALVLLVGDGHRTDRLGTLPIVTRAWYARHGFLFPPQFISMGADIWLTERASRDGRLVNAFDLNFEHRHPFYKKAVMDEIYRKSNDPAFYGASYKALAELLEPLPVSLCMITGNEDGIIARCLDAAAGAFDELCLVRAIGNLAPDATVDIARDWCRQNGKEFRFAEHQNFRPFPHCDDFAVARNLSFNLATKYWCLWLDADDLLDVENCRRLRESAMNSRFEAQLYRYLMPPGGEFYRERLIRRGHGIWENAVHEVCQIKGDACRVPEIEVRHAPPPIKEKSSATRNLSILATADFPRRDFYYHEELFRLGRPAEAVRAGLSALESLPEELAAERYEVCLNLATLQPSRTPHWALEAVKINPCRREALALLVQHALNMGDPQRAAVYFKWLDCVPVPVPKPWTHQNLWHGWGRNYLRVRVLRLIGKTVQADAEHEEFLKDAAYAKGVAEHLAGQ